MLTRVFWFFGLVMLPVALLQGCDDCASLPEGCGPDGPTATTITIDEPETPVEPTGWREASNPVFPRSAASSNRPDSVGQGAPAVIYDDDVKLFKMWYSALDRSANDGSAGPLDDGNVYPGREHENPNDIWDDKYQYIMYATSVDGVNWNYGQEGLLDENNLVMPASDWSTESSENWWETGSPWEGGVSSPTVILEDGVYHMWFHGLWFYSTWVCDYLDPRDYGSYQLYKDAYFQCTETPSMFTGANDPRLGKAPWFGPNKRDRELPGPPCNESQWVPTSDTDLCPDPNGCCNDFFLQGEFLNVIGDDGLSFADVANWAQRLYDETGGVSRHNPYNCVIYRASSILYSRSTDGVDWTEPSVVFHPDIYRSWPALSSDWVEDGGALMDGQPNDDATFLVAPSVMKDSMGTVNPADDTYRMVFTGLGAPISYLARREDSAGEETTIGFACYNSEDWLNQGPGSGADWVWSHASLETYIWGNIPTSMYVAESTDPVNWTGEYTRLEFAPRTGTEWDLSYSFGDHGFPSTISGYNEPQIMQPWPDPTHPQNCNYLLFYNAGPRASYISHIGVTVGKRQDDNTIAWDNANEVLGETFAWQRERVVTSGIARAWDSGGVRAPYALTHDDQLWLYYEGAGYLTSFRGSPREPHRNFAEHRDIALATRPLSELDTQDARAAKPYRGEFYCDPVIGS